jgi:hypothetical protein
MPTKDKDKHKNKATESGDSGDPNQGQDKKAMVAKAKDEGKGQLLHKAIFI